MADNHFKIDRGISMRPQASAPSNPSNGDIYYDSTLLKFRKYENGAWSDFGSGGSSSSGVNYISNPSAEVDTSGWATYADAAGNVPVDGTGGTATNLTFSRSTSSPLRGAGMFSLAQANSTSLQGKGVSYDFTIDIADKAKSLSLTFDYNASSTFVAGNGITPPLNDGTTTTNAGNSDIEVFIYDVTNAVLIPVSPQVITANGANNFSFKGTFQTASNSTSYRLIFHVATTSANATGWTFKFDNLALGPQALSQGPAMEDWTTSRTFTPSAGFGTVSNAVYETRRVGDSLEVVVNFTMGTVAATNLSLTLPAGLSIDTAKLPSNAMGSLLGFFTQGTSGTNTFPNVTGYVFYDGSTANSVFLTESVSGSSYQKVTGSGTFASNNPIAARFVIPILGWSSGSVMSNDTDTRVVAAQYYMSANTTPGIATPINFNTLDFDTHGAVTTGVGSWKFTAPVSGYYRVGGAVINNGTNGNVNIYKNGVIAAYLGIALASGSATGPAIVKLVAGDYIDIRGNTNMTYVGDPRDGTAQSFICIERISGPSSIAVTETIACEYNTTAGNTLSISTATFIDFGAKESDSHGSVLGAAGGNKTTTNTGWRFIAPVSGRYQVNAVISGTETGGPGTGSLFVDIYVNGSVVQRGNRLDLTLATTSALNSLVSGIVRLQAGDRIEIVGTQNVNTTMTMQSGAQNNRVSICRIGNY